jgi:hypothetical protein
VSDLTRPVQVLAALLFLLGTGCSDTVDQTPDEPPAEQPPPEGPPAEEPGPIGTILWDPQSQMIQVASTIGCDSWTPTWAPDDNLYTAIGDCRPEGVPRKIGMGFGRISGPTAESVAFAVVPTGDPDNWDDAATGAGVEAVGDDSASHKAAGMLHDGTRFWYWIRNITSTGTGVRLKFSDNYDSPNPAFTWVDWSLPAVGYASFVQYGQGYTGGPADYAYAVIPLSSAAAGSVSSSAYELVPAFGLLRGSRSDLTQQGGWEYFCGSAGRPAWCSALSAATPIFHAPGMSFTPRAGMSWNPGIGRFMLSLVFDPAAGTSSPGTRFNGGLMVLASPQTWGPWQMVFSSEGETWPGGTSTAACGSTDWGSGERADIPTKYMSEDGRTFYLFSSGGDCLSIARGVFRVAPEPFSAP